MVHEGFQAEFQLALVHLKKSVDATEETNCWVKNCLAMVANLQVVSKCASGPEPVVLMFLLAMAFLIHDFLEQERIQSAGSSSRHSVVPPIASEQAIAARLVKAMDEEEGLMVVTSS